MKINDKRKGNWRIIIAHDECPFITYPRYDIACEILEARLNSENKIDTYCCFENCPRKEILDKYGNAITEPQKGRDR